MAKKLSPAIQLLDHVWEHALKETGHSWERLNHSMRDALSLAIGSGMRFDEGDVKHVIDHYNSGYWLSDSDEWIYRLAVAVENMTAIKSYEAYAGREPYLADDVQIDADGGYTHGNYITRKRERLVVGCKFAWKGLTLTVTSFAADQSYVTACSYKPQKPDEYDSKIDKRFKISRADLLAERKERKERDDLTARLTAAAEANSNAEAIEKALGAKTRGDYARLPIEKIRKVAAKFLQSEAA